MRETLSELVREIVEAVTSVPEKTPPEREADLIDRGMILAGGGALLRGLDTLARRSYRHPGRCRGTPRCL